MQYKVHSSNITINPHSLDGKSLAINPKIFNETSIEPVTRIYPKNVIGDSYMK